MRSTLIPKLFHRIGIIFNPAAGGLRGSGRARLDDAVRVFQNAGAKVELIPTNGPNHGTELGREAAGWGCSLVLAAGGDGTINEVVNGIAGSGVPFGALPSGTANVLACEIGLAGRPDRAAAQLLKCVPTMVSVGRVRPGLNGTAGSPRNFVLMTGAGLDAQIVYKLNPAMKRRFGKLAYWHAGFSQLRRKMPHFTTIVDGETFEGTFTLITRVRNYGGDFEIARRVRLTDRDFEVVILQKDGWGDYMRFLGGVIANRLEKTPGVIVRRASRVEVIGASAETIYLQADGEAFGAIPATVETIPDALNLLLPRSYLS